jgi:ATP-dependent protease ClpP protease subunit
MKKLVVCLVVLGALSATLGFNYGRIVNTPIVFSDGFTLDTVQDLWAKIRRLDKLLPNGEVITLYLNSNGGDAKATVVLLERINLLQRDGRKFEATIYGYCYSACGSLFAIMDQRFMTANAVYMQHKAYSRNSSLTSDMIIRNIDRKRLKGDAIMLKRGLYELIRIFRNSDFVGNAKQMFNMGMIHGIVEQPDIEEI